MVKALHLIAGLDKHLCVSWSGCKIYLYEQCCSGDSSLSSQLVAIPKFWCQRPTGAWLQDNDIALTARNLHWQGSSQNKASRFKPTPAAKKPLRDISKGEGAWSTFGAFWAAGDCRIVESRAKEKKLQQFLYRLHFPIWKMVDWSPSTSLVLHHQYLVVVN